jgi:hypothetical protein
MATKVSDKHCIPLSDGCHRWQHSMGWPDFEAQLPGKDAVALAEQYWRAWPGMPDKQPALFRKVFGSLRPVTPAAEELLATVPDRAVRVEIKNIRGKYPPARALLLLPQGRLRAALRRG